MKNIEYDKEVDAAYFQIEDRQVIDSEEIADGIVVDYDKNDNIIGVELLGVKTLDLSNFQVLNPLLPESVKTKFREFFLTSKVLL